MRKKNKCVVPICPGRHVRHISTKIPLCITHWAALPLSLRNAFLEGDAKIEELTNFLSTHNAPAGALPTGDKE